MRKSLTDKGVAAIKPRAKRYAFPDPELAGHYIRVQPSGAKAFVVVARSPPGKQTWATLGSADVLQIPRAPCLRLRSRPRPPCVSQQRQAPRVAFTRRRSWSKEAQN